MKNLIQSILLTLASFVMLAGLASNPIHAQTYQARFTKQTCHQGFACRTQLEYGSATCIGRTESNRWIFLTVAHGVSNAAVTHVGLEVNGKPTWVVAKVLGWQFDQQTDIAILSVAYDGKLPCYPIYQSIPAIGEDVELIGFPTAGYRNFRTKIRSRSTVVGLNQVGESGGPVLVAGKLVGIQWGHSRSQNATYFTPVEKTRPLVLQKLGQWPDCVKKAEPHGQIPSDDSIPDFETLKQDIQLLKEQLACIKQRDSKPDDDLVQKLEQVDRRLKALEPLLQRRVVLEDDSGKVTAEQFYKPKDTIRLRSRYRDRR